MRHAQHCATAFALIRICPTRCRPYARRIFGPSAKLSGELNRAALSIFDTALPTLLRSMSATWRGIAQTQ